MAAALLDETITLAFSVSDRHASAGWYADKLGFQLLYHADEVGWSEMQTHTTGVIVGFSEATEVTKGNCVPVFGTPDIATSKAQLEAAGVRFEADIDEVPGMVKTVTFFDPDGNALMMAEDLTKAGQ